MAVPIKISRQNPNPVMVVTVAEIGTNKVVEVHRINTKTGIKEILFQDEKYKKLLNDKKT